MLTIDGGQRFNGEVAKKTLGCRRKTDVKGLKRRVKELSLQRETGIWQNFGLAATVWPPHIYKLCYKVNTILWHCVKKSI